MIQNLYALLVQHKNLFRIRAGWNWKESMGICWVGIWHKGLCGRSPELQILSELYVEKKHQKIYFEYTEYGSEQRE